MTYVAREGASATDLSEFESQYSVKLPTDFRQYLLTVNGMGEQGTCDNDFFSFWQLSDVRTIAEYMAEYLPDGANDFPDSSHFFLFADHSIFCPAFAIRVSQDDSTPNLIASVFAGGDGVEVESAFYSFTDFVEYYLRNPLGATVASLADA